MMGTAVGFVGSLIASTIRSRTPTAGLSGFSATAMTVIPTTVSAAVIYTLGSGLSRDIRGANDWANDFVGGACAGAVLNGVKQRSLQSGFLGAILFGCLGASAGVFSTMQPDSPDPLKLVDRYRMVTRPSDYGAAASGGAAAVTRRIA
jgi:uncharacterized membrane protein YeaQ/YmgE (transglycosylase-associated protein family)